MTRGYQWKPKESMKINENNPKIVETNNDRQRRQRTSMKSKEMQKMFRASAQGSLFMCFC